MEINVLMDARAGDVCKHFGHESISKHLVNRHIIILETAPQKRTIKVCDTSNRPTFMGTKTFYLQFPWMQFAFFRAKMGVAFKEGPGEAFTTLTMPPLPNVYKDSGKVCLGEKEIAMDLTVKDAIKFIGLFWMMKFDVYPVEEWKGLTALRKMWPVPSELRATKDPHLWAFQQWQEEGLNASLSELRSAGLVVNHWGAIRGRII
jgi:hypothetical protein